MQKKRTWMLAAITAMIFMIVGCGSISGPSGKFYRYSESKGSIKDTEYFEFSGSSLTYHDRDNMYKCEYHVNGDQIEIKLDYPGNPLDETFTYNSDEGTLKTKYDTFIKQ